LSNTFIRFIDPNADGEERIGFIVSIDNNNTTVTIRRFFSLLQLKHHVGANRFRDISLWPFNMHSHPFYLSDTDVTVVIPIHLVQGIAFVFYINDPILDKVQGMANTFVVSSFFNTNTMTCLHERSFQSFPSLAFSQFLPACIPLQLFRQLLSIKDRVQRKLNSRYMNSRFIVSCVCENISHLTWLYIKKLLPGEVITKLAVIKHVYMINDESVVEKVCSMQESFDLTLPDHLLAAQSIFGSSVGVDCRFLIRCSLKRRGRNAWIRSSQQIQVTDHLNVVPFEAFEPNENEAVSHGILLKYTPSEEELIVSVRFRLVHDEANLRNAFLRGGIVGDNTNRTHPDVD
jgi:hypothetical protein